MSALATHPRTTRVSGRALTLLGAVAVALGVAFVFAPWPLAQTASNYDFANQESLAASLRVGFVEYWNSGSRGYPSTLANVVDYWFRFHVIKGAISAMLLAVLIALGVLLGKAYLRAEAPSAGRRAAIGLAEVAVAMLAMVSLVALLANIQGAVAPFTSVMTMLPTHSPNGQLATAVAQIKQDLTGYHSASAPAPLRVMVDDDGRSHAVMVVLSAIVALGFIALSAVAWRRFVRAEASDRTAKRMAGWVGALSILLALAFAVVGAANLGTAQDPAPALLAFFQGGW